MKHPYVHPGLPASKDDESHLRIRHRGEKKGGDKVSLAWGLRAAWVTLGLGWQSQVLWWQQVPAVTKQGSELGEIRPDWRGLWK